MRGEVVPTPPGNTSNLAAHYQSMNAEEEDEQGHPEEDQCWQERRYEPGGSKLEQPTMEVLPR